MKRVWLLLVLGSVRAVAAPRLTNPQDDERKIVTGLVGARPIVVRARGLYVSGTDSVKGAFSQGGGEVAVELGIVPFPTVLNGLFGVEGEFSLGLMRSEAYESGQLGDQRRSSDAGDPAKVWLTTRLGLRYVVCPPVLLFGKAAARLGLVAGIQLEGSGARSWTQAGAFTVGAHLVFGAPGFGGRLAWLSSPPQQGEDSSNLRHQVSFDLAVGPVSFGARVLFDHVDTRSMMGRPATVQDSTTFSLAIGYASDPFTR